MIRIEKSDRLKSLQPYLFKEIDRQKEEVRKKGVDIIDLGVGDPDMPTPPHIIEALNKAAIDPANHRYPSYSGMHEFNETVARWYKRRFNVDLDPGREVVTLIGSKEGIAHIPLAFINNNDFALVSSPGYPVYDIGVKFAGGQTYFMDLLKKNNFLPDLDAVPKEIAGKAKMMFINYPNNPTSAVADGDFFKKVVSFAELHNIVVCHDAAYTEMAFDGYRPISFLETICRRHINIIYGHRIALYKCYFYYLRFIRRIHGRNGQGKHVLMRFFPGIFKNTSFVTNVKQVSVSAVWL